MRHRLPIVAYSAAAVPETLGDAGVLIETKDAATVAAAVARVTRDVSLRDALVDRGAERARQFDPERSAKGFVAAVTGTAVR
jgi:glycosyltransferase involved in cell wall biosynthesis